MVVLRLSGGLSLEHADGSAVPAGARQRRRLELLALLALGGLRGVGRERLQALLWPDKPDDDARHALEQLVYLVRRDLGPGAVVADGLTLRLDPAVVACDVASFDAAVAAGDLARAAGIYAGPLMDGVRLGRAPDLERWLQEQRDAWAQRYARVLERLAESAEKKEAHGDAVEWWQRRAALDPFNGPATLGLMRARAAMGDAAGAIRHARVYEGLVRNELGLEPAAEVTALAATLSQGRADTPGRDGRHIVHAAEHAVSSEGVSASTGRPEFADVVASMRRDHYSTVMALGRALRTRRSLAPAAAVVAMLALSIVLGATRHTVLARATPAAATSVAVPLKPAAADTPSYAAFEHFVRGSYYLNQRGGATRAADELRAAIAAFPRYARAYAGLAEAYNTLAEASDGRTEQATLLARAEVAARRATTLDPQLAEAHTSLGNFLLNQWQWDAAAGEFRRAITSNPSYARGYTRYAILLALRADFHTALAMLHRAEELDPLSLRIRDTHVYVLYLARRYRESEAAAEQLVALDSTRESARFYLGAVLLGAGRYADAARELAAASRLPQSGQQRALPLLGYAYARAGRTADARRLRPLIERGLADRSISPYYAAVYFGAVGERERAFAVLEDLGDNRETCLRDLAVDPVMDSLRKDPRFERVLEAIGLAPAPRTGGPT